MSLDYKMICGRCKLAVNPSRGLNSSKSMPSEREKNSILRIVGWIFLIYLGSAMVGGLLSMDSTEPNPPGAGDENYYEQNGVDDTFVGTP